MSSKNILLVESHYRSRTWFSAIKSAIKGDLSTLFVISVVPEEKKRFIKKGMQESHILDLYNIVDQPEDRDEVLRSIEDLHKINFSLLIHMDRTLKTKKEAYIKEYIYQCYVRISEFIEANNIGIIFFEPTWMHEYLVNAIAEIKNIKIYAPATVRIPSNRFVFFKGMNQAEFYKRKLPNFEFDMDEILEGVRENKKPDYFYIGNLRSKFNLNKINILLLLIKNLINNNYNKNIHQNILKTIAKKILSMVRARFISLWGYFDEVDLINKKYVLLTLHVQPEQSIDVLSPFYSNQIELIRLLRLTIPINCLLVVKEHPNAIGDRALGFYKEVKKIRGVRVISPYVDSHLCIKNAECTISNTGTSVLEAAILEKKSTSIETMFFGLMLTKESFSPVNDKVSEIIKAGSSSIKIEDYRKILSNSFLGDTTDFISDRRVLRKNNIRLLENAFFTVINDYPY